MIDSASVDIIRDVFECTESHGLLLLLREAMFWFKMTIYFIVMVGELPSFGGLQR